MKNKKYMYIIGMLCILSIKSYSKPVQQDIALQVAENFFCSNSNQYKALTTMRVFGEKNQPAMFAFSSDDSWVLIAGENSLPPILAYSDEGSGSFPLEDEMPPAMFDLMKSYLMHIDSIRKANITRATHPLWSTYINNNNVEINNSRSVIVGPMLSRNGNENIWGQSENNEESSVYDSTRFYNKFCPHAFNNLSGDSCISAVGCGALSASQVMWYWQWPYAAVVTNDAHYPLLRNYNWDLMPYRLMNSTSLTKVNMIANLLHDVGVSIDMIYGCSFSYYAGDIVYTLENIYGYTTGGELYRRNYTDSTWINMIKTEMIYHRPVLYSGNSNYQGHEFVIDGYNSSNQFHINYGWKGLFNGYYSLGEFEYFKYNAMIVNIHPNYPSCSSITIPSSDTWTTNFIIQNGGGISVGNRTVASGMHGCIFSGEYVKLTNGFKVEANASVYIDIKDMHCQREKEENEEENEEHLQSYAPRNNTSNEIPFANKILYNGHLYITREGKVYTLIR